VIPLPALEEVTGRSGIAPRIELLLPTGVRPPSPSWPAG
jgi:hypothetical protein